MLVDSDGTGKVAKNEAHNLEKKLKTFEGVEEISIINSGGTGNISGGGIFGIIFAIAIAGLLGFFVYRKRHSITPSSRFDNVNFSSSSEGNTNNSTDVRLSSIPNTTELTAIPKKRRAPLPQKSQVDALFSETKTGMINVNYDSSSTNGSDIAEHDDSKDDQSELVPGLSGDTIIVRVPSLGGEQTQNEFENINFTSEA